MTTQQMRDELEKIIKDHIYQNNSKYASYNAKQFMDWTGIGYDDLLWDTDPELADYYDIMMSHWLPSLSDTEIEGTYTNLYYSWFQDNWYYNHQQKYDEMKRKIIEYDRRKR